MTYLSLIKLQLSSILRELAIKTTKKDWIRMQTMPSSKTTVATLHQLCLLKTTNQWTFRISWTLTSHYSRMLWVLANLTHSPLWMISSCSSNSSTCTCRCSTISRCKTRMCSSKCNKKRRLDSQTSSKISLWTWWCRIKWIPKWPSSCSLNKLMPQVWIQPLEDHKECCFLSKCQFRYSLRCQISSRQIRCIIQTASC